MTIIIRPQTAQSRTLLPMLQQKAALMAQVLHNNGIDLVDGSMAIWVKEHKRTGTLFPKIEFDAGGQELQYGLNAEGNIVETHFKAFERNFEHGKTFRSDVTKQEACVILQRIDDIISAAFKSNP